MGMSIEDCIHKLDFSIGAYQKLIDENVSNGEVVGTGVRGTWTASTPLTKAYSDMIEALQTAKEIMHKYQQIEQIINEWSTNMKVNTTMAMCEIEEVVEDGKAD